MPVAFYIQTRFRFRNDDGSETAATWKAAEDTDANITIGQNFRLRIQVDEDNMGAVANTFNLYYSLNSGSYTAVSGSTPVQFSASSQFADGDDTTSQLTGATGTYFTDNNGMKETTGGIGITLSKNYYFDSEWCLKLDPAQVSATDTIDFRIYAGTSALAAYTVTPRATSTNTGMGMGMGMGLLLALTYSAAAAAAYSLDCDSGAFTLTGTDATFDRGVVLDVENGSFTLTGTDVSLDYVPVGAYSLDCDSGSFSLTGTDVTFDRGVVLGVDSGSFTLTGTDAGLLASLALSADSGSFALTGTDIAFNRTYAIGADSGAFLLTGTDVDWLRTYIFDLQSGSFVLTGADAALTWTAVRVGTTASLVNADKDGSIKASARDVIYAQRDVIYAHTKRG